MHAIPCSNAKSSMGNLKVEDLELTQRTQTMLLASPFTVRTALPVRDFSD